MHCLRYSIGKCNNWSQASARKAQCGFLFNSFHCSIGGLLPCHSLCQNSTVEHFLPLYIHIWMWWHFLGVCVSGSRFPSQWNNLFQELLLSPTSAWQSKGTACQVAWWNRGTSVPSFTPDVIAESKRSWRSLLEVYGQESTLHGLRYMGLRGSHVVRR